MFRTIQQVGINIQRRREIDLFSVENVEVRRLLIAVNSPDAVIKVVLGRGEYETHVQDLLDYGLTNPSSSFWLSHHDVANDIYYVAWMPKETFSNVLITVENPTSNRIRVLDSSLVVLDLPEEIVLKRVEYNEPRQRRARTETLG